MFRNPKLKDFGITINGIERVYVAFTRSEARAMAKRELGLDRHDRLPPGTPVRELGKVLTCSAVSA